VLDCDLLSAQRLQLKYDRGGRLINSDLHDDSKVVNGDAFYRRHDDTGFALGGNASVVDRSAKLYAAGSVDSCSLRDCRRLMAR
jgi:hypothetical protein